MRLTLYSRTVGGFKAKVVNRRISLESDVHGGLAGLEHRRNCGSAELPEEGRARHGAIPHLDEEINTALVMIVYEEPHTHNDVIVDLIWHCLISPHQQAAA